MHSGLVIDRMNPLR